MDKVTTLFPEMLTIREAAERIGLSYGQVRRLCLANEGKFFIKIGQKYFINQNQFLAFLKGDDE